MNPEDIDRLCRSAEPPEPTEADWARVLDRIQRGVEHPQVQVSPLLQRKGWMGLVSIVTAAAAAAAMFFFYVRVPVEAPGTQQPGEVTQQADAFPVTSSEDVDIVSVEATDSDTLVVGDLPLRKPIVLVEPGDIALRSVERNPNGEWVQMGSEGEAAPMVWAPLAVGGKD
jgi:hypothetical protein